MKQSLKTTAYTLSLMLLLAIGLYFGSHTIWLAVLILMLTGVFDLCVVIVAFFTTNFTQNVELGAVENGGEVTLTIRTFGWLGSFCPAIAMCSGRCYKLGMSYPIKRFPMKTARAVFTLPAHGIGRFCVGAVRFYVESPFGIWALPIPKKKSKGFPCNVLITPRTYGLKPFLFYPMPLSNIDPRLMIVQNAADQAADVRQYVQGDPLHAVNWKLTASRQQLYVRQFESDSREISAQLYLQESPNRLFVQMLEGAMSAGAALLANRPLTLTTWKGDKISFNKGDSYGLARALAAIEPVEEKGGVSPLMRLKELQNQGQCAVVLWEPESEVFPYIYSLPRGSIVVLCGDCTNAALDLEKIKEFGINIYLCARVGELICPIIE